MCVCFNSPSEGVPKGACVCVLRRGAGRGAAQRTGENEQLRRAPRRERILDPALVGAGRRDGEGVGDSGKRRNLEPPLAKTQHLV